MSIATCRLTTLHGRSISGDLHGRSTTGRAGLDVIWKPDAAHQLTATLNPDFGQVESDDLVVNFTAIETFFTDKRPFFTQNQQLFDLETTADGVLVNTRRIGAAPDAGEEGVTDIVAATKYSYTGRQWELGSFAAMEDDSQQARGRDFAALRVVRNSDDERWRAGYLGTYTHRPALDRTATVHAADVGWIPGGGWAVNAQAIATRPSGSPSDRLAGEAGFGAWAGAGYLSTGKLRQTMRVSSYDRHYDINDLGFMTRNSLRELQSQTYWYRRDYAADSPLSATHWFFDARVRENALGESLPSRLEIGHFWQFRDSSSLYIYARPQSSGYDDLSARGTGTFKLPPQHEARISFLGPTTGSFRYFAWLKTFREGLDGYGWEALARPSWLPVDTFKLMLEATYRDSPDWLIWRADEGRMTQHSRKLLQTSLSADWYPSPRSEVRLRIQWAGLRAAARQPFDIDAGRRLVPAGAAVEDFSYSDLAAQLRLRYEFRPLSELFVVYSYGGFAQLQEQAGFRTLWDTAVEHERAHQILIKLSYRL